MKRPRGVMLLGVLFLLVGVLLTGGVALALVTLLILFITFFRLSSLQWWS